MKSKRSLIIWLCVYALELAGVLTIILKNRERWLFNDYSAFPIFYILVCIFFAFYLPSFHNARREHNRFLQYMRWNFKHFDDHDYEIDFVERVRRGEWLDPWWSFMSRVCIALIPFFMLFVFFFDFGPKAASFGFALMIYALMMILYLLFGSGELKEAKEHRQKRQKELEEQKRREELGKWK